MRVRSRTSLARLRRRLDRPRGLGGRYRLLICPKVVAPPERANGHLRTMGVAVTVYEANDPEKPA